jgi:hypothetical protein
MPALVRLSLLLGPCLFLTRVLPDGLQSLSGLARARAHAASRPCLDRDSRGIRVDPQNQLGALFHDLYLLCLDDVDLAGCAAVPERQWQRQYPQWKPSRGIGVRFCGVYVQKYDKITVSGGTRNRYSRMKKEGNKRKAARPVIREPALGGRL